MKANRNLQHPVFGLMAQAQTRISALSRRYGQSLAFFEGIKPLGVDRSFHRLRDWVKSAYRENPLASYQAMPWYCPGFIGKKRQ